MSWSTVASLRGVGVIVDNNYNPFAGRSEAEILEWHIFITFLILDPDGTTGWMSPDGAHYHVEYVLQRPFQNVTEWLGLEGDRYRKVNGYRQPIVSEQFKAEWASFLAERRNLTLEGVQQEVKKLAKRHEQARVEGRIHVVKRRKRRVA